MLKEIGSEFWIERGAFCEDSRRDGSYVLSGRTAMDMIIGDVRLTRKLSVAYLPAWCCDSMIAPFLGAGVKVKLYDMSLTESGLEYMADPSVETDLLFVCNYFGYSCTMPESLIADFRRRGAVVVYDMTHSLLRDEPVPDWADYYFASLRKWMNVVTGALIGKRDGTFPTDYPQCPYWTVRRDAMFTKSDFIAGDASALKSVFLAAYGEFGHRLVEDRGYGMDDLSYSIWKSCDRNSLRKRRMDNASVLHRNLEGVRFLSDLREGDCPLFVPVFMDTREQRDKVRSYLVSKDIYCPVHWGRNCLVTEDMAVNAIFDTEMSVICDQRYGMDEMKRIINEIKNIFGKI